MDWDTLVEGVESEMTFEAEYNKDEIAINSNPALHMFAFEGKKLDTKIVICPECKKRYLNIAFKTHTHEIHPATVVEEADGGDKD